MTQEDKDLLLRDLSARLPYGVKCSCTWSHEAPNGTIGCIQELSTFLIDEIEIMDNPEYDCQICDVKPYLHPMSSMTEEEKREYNLTKTLSIVDYPTLESFDWLLAHHFDFRNLIEHGLAIAVTEENNPYKS